MRLWEVLAELREPFRLTLGGGPATNLIPIDGVASGHHQSLPESLLIVPVVKRGQAVHHALRRRQQLEQTRCVSLLTDSTNRLVSDRERCV